ncbi:LysR family transcriptional regulator [Phreatobacter stygius]|uniref:LysR family transcriptional regulator n=1 Tax=Phreatobacter stygius TaxID=1940610 RepID=A0A4D7B6W0_9HYPH|nr:LysR family transcriptional regulator [Phreatobacter stygius]QCI66040.1 LysR family transcriptional regulator [Phreatobacter stygius]
MGFVEDARIFARAVEKGSFSAAGRDLRMSAAVVSSRILALEQKLGCRLFNRTTRKIQLTSVGRSFFERIVDVLDAVERAEASVALEGGAPRGSLKVTAPLGLGRRLVGPVVTTFRAAQPNIDIRLRLAEHLLDLIGEGIDLALRMADLSDSSFIVRKVATIERILCASPAYIEAHGAPKTPDDLFDHQCLLLRFPGSRQFRLTLRQGREARTLAVSGAIDCDDGDVLTQWALAGSGIVMKPVFEVAEQLTRGTLVQVMPDATPEPTTLAIIYPSRQLPPPGHRAFSDLLLEAGRSHVATELGKLGKRLEN